MGSPEAFSSEFQQTHRRALVSFWDIKPGSRVLELGGGQGDCTIVLAKAVGETGHVDAVDPGAADYGSPLTLSQAQALITSGPLGPRITFYTATDPIAYLSTYTGPPYDYIVLAHCIYYFANPSTLPSLLSALKPHCDKGKGKLCLAEWSLKSSNKEGWPHVLTVLLMSQLIVRSGKESEGNVRTILSPRQIKEKVEEVGFVLENEVVKEGIKGQEDGRWETAYLLRKREKVVKGLREQGVGEREVLGLESMYDAVAATVEGLEGGVEGVGCMDFWVGRWGVVRGIPSLFPCWIKSLRM